jgi:hypothetical protein
VRQRRIRAALVAALGALAIVAAIVGSRGGGHVEKPHARPQPPRAAVRPVQLSSRVVGQLAAPEQNAAVTRLGLARTVLLGGLTAADVSRPDVVVLRGSHQTAHALLPVALHDAAAATIGRSVYLFGGANTAPSDRIYRVSIRTGAATQAGKLPKPLSDIAATTVGNTVFIVGGYDGVKATNRILAWSKTGTARTVGKLPHPLRYAAVTALGQVVYIAGGTTGTNATRDVFAFDTRDHSVRKVSRLPRATTHAATAAFGCCVYVIGGRGSKLNTPIRRIFAFDPVRRHLEPAGHLPVPLSDLAAVTQRRRILVVGGRSPAGTVGTIVQLKPRR